MPGDDEELFRKAMRDAIPLEPDERRARAPKQPPSPRPKPRPKPRPPGFSIERDGEAIAGRAPGVNRKQLAELRAGRVPIDGTVDLHRMTADAATAMLRGRVLAAAREGKACLLVIHGRGLHSAGAPVLRDAVVQCLTTTPCAAHVRGFCTARPQNGGPGAMYIWLT